MCWQPGGYTFFLHLRQVKQSLCAYIIVPTLPFPLLPLPFPDRSHTPPPPPCTHTRFNGSYEPRLPQRPKWSRTFFAWNSLQHMASDSWDIWHALIFLSKEERKSSICLTSPLYEPLDGLNATKTDPNLWLCRAADLNSDVRETGRKLDTFLKSPCVCAFPPLLQAKIKSYHQRSRHF